MKSDGLSVNDLRVLFRTCYKFMSSHSTILHHPFPGFAQEER